MSLPTDVDLCTIRLPDKITDRGTQTKLVDFALAIDNMRRKLHAGLTDLGSVKIGWHCGVETDLIGTTIGWRDVLKPDGVVLVPGPRFLNLLLTIEDYWKRNENARQKKDTKRKTFYWNDLADMTAKESTYTLLSSTDTVREGDSFVVTLTADNVDPGVSVGYNITGVDRAVISGAQKYGDIVVGGPQIRSYTVAADSISSNKTFNFILSPADTAGTLTGSPSLSLTFLNLDVSYLLSCSTDVVGRGQSFTLDLTANDVADGTTVEYNITGISSDQIGGVALNNNFTVSGEAASISYTIPSYESSVGLVETVSPTDETKESRIYYYNDDLTFFNSDDNIDNISTAVNAVIPYSQKDDNRSFSRRYTGYFRPALSDNYGFRLKSDDSSLLYIGPTDQTIDQFITTIQVGNYNNAAALPYLAVNNSGNHSVLTVTDTIDYSFNANQLYPIVIYYGNRYPNQGSSTKQLTFSHYHSSYGWRTDLSDNQFFTTDLGTFTAIFTLSTDDSKGFNTGSPSTSITINNFLT